MNFPFLLICLSVGIGITEGTQKQVFQTSRFHTSCWSIQSMVTVVKITLYLYNLMVALYVFLQKFPCDFNIYDSVQDGRITSEEFFTFTHKHGYDAESSDIFFKTMDSNGNIVYYAIIGQRS